MVNYFYNFQVIFIIIFEIFDQNSATYNSLKKKKYAYNLEGHSRNTYPYANMEIVRWIQMFCELCDSDR